MALLVYLPKGNKLTGLVTDMKAARLGYLVAAHLTYKALGCVFLTTLDTASHRVQ